ncbi:MAG: hypothetical protein ACTIL2_09690 [Corynebacterium sp.]|uniref:hypothetical protein n=1 Tax=Corynebacterium sp. TaxID=1720 RepID=UPI003F965671
MNADRTRSIRRRFFAGAATIALTAGLGAGVASAEATSTTTTAATSSSVDTKRAPADVFNCNVFPNLWYCR